MAKNRLINEDTFARGDMDPDAPAGFCAQTVNGSAYWQGTGWNREDKFYHWPDAEAGGPWQPGRSNRTAE